MINEGAFYCLCNEMTPRQRGASLEADFDQNSEKRILPHAPCIIEVNSIPWYWV